MSRIYSPRDGLDVNRIKNGHNISRRKYLVTSYDDDGVVLSISFLTESIHRIGIMNHIRKINKYKGHTVNSEKSKLNKKA